MWCSSIFPGHRCAGNSLRYLRLQPLLSRLKSCHPEPLKSCHSERSEEPPHFFAGCIRENHDPQKTNRVPIHEAAHRVPNNSQLVLVS